LAELVQESLAVSSTRVAWQRKEDMDVTGDGQGWASADAAVRALADASIEHDSSAGFWPGGGRQPAPADGILNAWGEDAAFGHTASPAEPKFSRARSGGHEEAPGSQQRASPTASKKHAYQGSVASREKSPRRAKAFRSRFKEDFNEESSKRAKDCIQASCDCIDTYMRKHERPVA